MSIGRWSFIAAIGLAVFVLVGLSASSLAVPEVFGQTQSSVDQSSQQQPGSSSGQQEQANKPSWWDWARRFVSAEDTLAQWVMAFLSFGALVVSGAAVWLVSETLKETKKAVADSARAAKAAEAAVEVTRESAEKQLRAYVEVVSVRLGDETQEGAPAPVHVCLKNTGQTPARDFRSFGEAFSGPYPIDEHLEPPTLSNWGGSSIGAGAEVTMIYRIAEIYNRDLRNRLRQGNYGLFVHGSLNIPMFSRPLTAVNFGMYVEEGSLTNCSSLQTRKATNLAKINASICCGAHGAFAHRFSNSRHHRAGRETVTR
jgi:hypothetical protein